jgi:hypothetical protein
LGVRFAFLKRRRRNDFLDRRLDVCCYRRLWFWCCLLLLLKQIWSCNCDFCWRRSVMSFDKVIKQWFRIVVCVCAALRVLDVWCKLNILAQLLQSAFPFYCWNSNWKD